ncbi:MAG: hypothetical protein Kapaf2KO_08840 [Candidatus Kapaibacteriales bacterium]
MNSYQQPVCPKSFIVYYLLSSSQNNIFSLINRISLFLLVFCISLEVSNALSEHGDFARSSAFSGINLAYFNPIDGDVVHAKTEADSLTESGIVSVYTNDNGFSYIARVFVKKEQFLQGIRVVNMLGKEVFSIDPNSYISKKPTDLGTEYEFLVQQNRLTPGMYMFGISGTGFRDAERFVIRG